MTTTTTHHTPAAAGVSVLEPAMANQLPVTPEEDEAFEALARRNDELETEKHTLATLADQQERKIEQLSIRLSDATEMIKGCPSLAAVRRRDAGIMADAMDWVLAQAASEENEGVMWRTKIVAPRICELRKEAAGGES
ncbi:MAG: hypothetical protein VX796_06035 [Pseudomonadota bacterium]|nr:hypothetical protein [Pseudomonadota bacterium]